MGKFLDFLMDYNSGRKRCNEFLDFRKKYKKEAMEEYESNNLEGWINERAEMDLNPDDNVKKYKTDLKRWFLQVKEAYNSNFSWDRISLPADEKEKFEKKLEISNNDFPLIYYIKDSSKMNKNIGYEVNLEYEYDYMEEEDSLSYYLLHCPEPRNYMKSHLTVMKNKNKRNFYKKSRRR